MSNKLAYESKNQVKHYYSLKDLLPPEQTILDLFKNKLKNMKMLDIGVGGGRTTPFFAPLTKEYIGMDYSENMIKICQQRFPNFTFKVCDVRDMNMFEDNYFDFILISMNSLDYISHEDRLIALKEIKRVCKKNGFILHSSHNLQAIKNIFSFRLTINPVRFAWRTYKYLQKRLLNKSVKKLIKEDYATLYYYKNIHKFETYYIKPKEQIKQLKEFDFKNIKIYSQNGQEINESVLDTTQDYWLYYLFKNEHKKV